MAPKLLISVIRLTSPSATLTRNRPEAPLTATQAPPGDQATAASSIGSWASRRASAPDGATTNGSAGKPCAATVRNAEGSAPGPPESSFGGGGEPGVVGPPGAG